MRVDESQMTVCAHCNKKLIGVEILHAMDGFLFCSQDCTVKYAMNDIIQNAEGMANERYWSEAEEVRSSDILREEFLTADEIKNICKKLGETKRFYRNIMELTSEEGFEKLAGVGFKDAVDLIIYLESDV